MYLYVVILSLSPSLSFHSFVLSFYFSARSSSSCHSSLARRDRYYFQRRWHGQGWAARRRGLPRGWLGCFAARNTLHYTVGVVYKRLFFFSLASRYPPPPLAALLFLVFTFLSFFLSFFLSLPHLFLLEATSTCQQVSESVSGGGRWVLQGVTSRKASADCTLLLLLLLLPLSISVPRSPSISFLRPSVFCFLRPPFSFWEITEN